MNQEVGFYLLRRTERQLLVRAVHRIAGLKCDYLAPAKASKFRSSGKPFRATASITFESVSLPNAAGAPQNPSSGGTARRTHTVVAAGTVVRAGVIPPFSLVVGNEVKPNYYLAKFEARQKHTE